MSRGCEYSVAHGITLLDPEQRRVPLPRPSRRKAEETAEAAAKELEEEELHNLRGDTFLPSFEIAIIPVGTLTLEICLTRTGAATQNVGSFEPMFSGKFLGRVLSGNLYFPCFLPYRYASTRPLAAPTARLWAHSRDRGGGA